MKHIFALLSLLIIFSTAHAQAPQGIPYQAVARNSSGAVLASTNISVRFTIRDSIATGVIKYRETHSVTTTTLGMFSVHVGQGTPVSGTFIGINWGTNAKFMQVEIDPAGGSSYIDMGTQQMMSVPYSIYSSSSGNGFPTGAVGDIMYHNGTNWVKLPAGTTGQVLTMGSGGTPVWGGCTLPSAGTITGTATVTAGSTTTLSNATIGGTWSSSATGVATVGSTGVVMGVAAGTATISYTVTNTCGSTVATTVVTVNAASTTVGSTFGGGVVAYILQPGDPGYIAGETHGLIAAPSDQSTGIQWGCFGTTVGGTSTALGTGAANTTIVSSACGAGTAARLCADLVLGGYSDWYLPSRDELQKLYINSSSIGGFNATGYYWSSSEYAANVAWVIYFFSGSTNYFDKGNTHYVRAVRAFSYPEAISGTSTVCVGSTTTLTSATTGGTWSSSNTGVATVNSSGVVSGVSAGTVVISYAATGSFTTRILTVNPLPSAGTITGTATVTAGSTTTLSNATTGGTWSSGATGIATVGSTGVVSGVAAGTATISYTVTNGCGSAAATRVVTVNAAALPILTTTTVGAIVSCAASSGGTISSDGGNAITAKGVVWSTSPNPTIALTTKTSDGTGAGSFTSSINGLTATTTYYVRAYATNITGTSYGTEYSFTTLSGSMCIGATFGGGVIAYILQPGDPGYIVGETHGLIAAPSDQSTGIQWGCFGTAVGGTSTALGTGAANTAIVSSACGAGTAASLCADLVLGGYSDWYLPSIYELQKLYINRSSIGGFTTGHYWSSSEHSADYAWGVNFANGFSFANGKYFTYMTYVRAVRAF